MNIFPFLVIFTARIRRMTGGYVFTGVCLFNFQRGGVTYLPADGGGSTYIPADRGGVPTFQPMGER